MRHDTRLSDPHRGERDQITAGTAGTVGALGAIAAIVLILIGAPQGLITTVGTLALVATVLAVTIMVRRRPGEAGERS